MEMNSESNQIPFEAPQLHELQALFPTIEIESFLAQGGMGAVYLGMQKSLQRQVAIKILPRELGQDEAFRASFTQEARAMAKLNHPNLIGVYDFGEADGMPFIVMEYVHGKSLHDASHGMQINIDTAGEIVVKVCRGLKHAHEKEIHHRDVKPANILLDTSTEPKLGDFGLASGRGDADGLIYGTPGFAAPEVYRGQGDHRSDLYAAAVTLHSLITGEMPDSPYRPASTFCGDARLDNFLIKALQPNPNARFQDASAFVEALETALKKSAAPQFKTGITSSVPPIPPTTLRPSVQKNKSLTPVFLGLGMLALLGLGLLVLNSGGRDQEGPLADEVVVASTESEVGEETPEEEPPLAAVEPAEDATTALRDSVSVEQNPINAETEKGGNPKEIVMAAEPEALPPPPTEQHEKPAVRVSTFQHDTFLRRGRDYFRQKGRGHFDKYSAGLLENISQLEKDARRLLSSEPMSRNAIDEQKSILKLTTRHFEEQGQLPSDLATVMPNGILGLSLDKKKSRKLASSALEAQAQLRRNLEQTLAPLAREYSKGVLKQADALREEGNEIDAKILEEEARLAVVDRVRFAAILEGEPLPAGRKPTEKELQIAKLVLGQWDSQTTGESFHFLEYGGLSRKGENVDGLWKVRVDSVLLAWEGGAAFELDARGLGKNPDAVEGKEVASSKSIRLTRNVPFAKQKNSDFEDIAGIWVHEANDGPVEYRFTPDGKADDGRWNSRGFLRKNLEGGFQVNWVGGRTFSLDFEDENTLIIRGKNFRMHRQR